jgi:hypothetical protein
MSPGETCRPIAAWLLVSLPLACAHPQHGPVGHATPHVPGIRIVKPEQALKLGLKGARFDLPFGDNQDGTKLVLDFLDEAKRAGARYVSDIRIVLVTWKGGGAIACETRLLPFVQKDAEIVPHQTPARVETRSVMKPVTRTVTEYQYRCHPVTRPVTRMETTYQYQYDYASKSSRSVPVTRMVTHYEHRSECRSEPVTRTVTRYEHQLETKYIPPSLTYLKAHYTDFDLIESRPVCTPTAASAARQRLPHRVTGTIYVDKERS